MAKTAKNQNPRFWYEMAALSLVAGILYCSWPLGYWLNPVATRGLASNLEALHQPYNWLFILLDIISGTLCCVVAWALRKRIGGRERWILFATIGLAGFGILTSLDAVLPLDCISIHNECTDPFTNPFFIVHGIASFGSIFFLTLTLLSVWWLYARHYHIRWQYRAYLHMAVLTWIGFGLITAWLVLNNEESTLSQRIFIVLCSLFVATLPSFIHHTQRTTRRMSRSTR